MLPLKAQNDYTFEKALGVWLPRPLLATPVRSWRSVYRLLSAHR